MSVLFTRLPWFCFLVVVVVVVVLLFFSFLPVEVICQLPRRLVHLALLLVCRRNSIIPSSRQPVRCYSVATAVRGARLRSRANCCGNLQLSRFAVSCNYRAVLEMMVKVKCKLTGIEITLSSYGRCAPYCRFRVSKPNKKRIFPIFKKLLCSFIFSFPDGVRHVTTFL